MGSSSSCSTRRACHPYSPTLPPASLWPCVCLLGPPHADTRPPTQGQFLCLAVLEGRLVLLYDFGEGLQEAKPMQPPPPLTVASKAVRLQPEDRQGEAGLGWQQEQRRC